MPESAHLHLRISPALKEQLLKLAQAENRSLSNLVETLLIKALQAPK